MKDRAREKKLIQWRFLFFCCGQGSCLLGRKMALQREVNEAEIMAYTMYVGSVYQQKSQSFYLSMDNYNDIKKHK